MQGSDPIEAPALEVEAKLPRNRAERRAERRAAQVWMVRQRCLSVVGPTKSGESTTRLLAHVNRLVADRHKRGTKNMRYIRRAMAALDREMASENLQTG